MKPLVDRGGEVSRDHHYLLFGNGERVVTFAIPDFVNTPTAIRLAKEMLGAGWGHFEIDDPTYGTGGTQEDIDRWSAEWARERVEASTRE